MKVIIIAAGDSSRLKDLAEEKPKGLLEINGKTILARQIELFKKKNIHDITIITGPHKYFGISNLSYINDKNYGSHDVLGSLMAAKDKINGKVITSYSDIIFEEKILNQLLQFDGDVGIPIDLNWEKSYEGRTQHPKSEADNVLLKGKKILQIKKNITAKNEDELIGEFLGPIVFSKNGSKIFVETYKKLEKSHKGTFHDALSLEKGYLTDMIQELIENEVVVTPIFISGKWYEIDTQQDLERAKTLFA